MADADSKMQGPDQSADFDSRAIGQRHGSARRTQPDPQNTGRIVGEFTDAIEGKNDRVKQADRHRPKFIRSVSRDTAKRSYNPTLEAAVSVAMAHRRKKPIELTYRGQPILTHCIPPTMRPACRHSLTLARFGSPRIGPNSPVPRSIFASMLRRNDV